MRACPKILMLDDDQELLELYRCILVNLPSKPDVHTASTGARAMALLESEPFHLLICDLKMPKIDGLQVVSIVRQKYPQLRVVVLTALHDDQFRSRAYAMGVDLFWEKPGSEQEMTMFRDCVESLLGQEEQAGFRGVQRKGLVDLIQLECLSQSSSVLKVAHGAHEGRIWILQGEVIDAAVLDLRGEEAFKKILSWKAGNFEIQPPEADRPRTILNSYQNLLLESAQALDEAQLPSAAEAVAVEGEVAPGVPAGASPLGPLARVPGVEFLVLAKRGPPVTFDSWGAENPAPVAHWSWEMHERLRKLGEELRAGELRQVVGLGAHGHVALVTRGDTALCAGLARAFSREQVGDTLQRMQSQWAS